MSQSNERLIVIVCDKQSHFNTCFGLSCALFTKETLPIFFEELLCIKGTKKSLFIALIELVVQRRLSQTFGRFVET